MQKIIIKFLHNKEFNSNYINFDIYLQNHFLNFPFVSQYTNYAILKTNSFLDKITTGDLIIDTYYRNLLVRNKGLHYMNFLKAIAGFRTVNYLCLISVDNISKIISKTSFRTKCENNK